ncbi:MAG TPA: hypothetical protein VFQ45_03525 [Longimicrobium sp.]|nr:hypothetical protein [Longimicrobium sp.]
MRKLKLDLEALQVDSFSTAADGEAMDGTVHGHATWPVGGCTIVVQPGPPPHKKTLVPFCPPTYGHTCGGDFTCLATECEGSCLPGHTCHPAACNNSFVVCPAPSYDAGCTTKTTID